MLSYLRGKTSEVRQEVDLPSLVQTVLTREFADRGHPIAYAGCYHLVYSCRPNSLTRALGSVVETCIGHNRDYAVALGASFGHRLYWRICPGHALGPSARYRADERMQPRPVAEDHHRIAWQFELSCTICATSLCAQASSCPPIASARGLTVNGRVSCYFSVWISWRIGDGGDFRETGFIGHARSAHAQADA